MKFSHLHNHTQFSLLDGASSIKNLYKKAIADGMPAMAITDHGNMFGVFDFVNEAYKHKNDDGSLKVKPIVGCEFYMVEDMTINSFTKGKKDDRKHQLLLAKNEEGYKNLVKLCSLGFIEGLYGKYPRIDKQLLLQYKEGIIATTCCLGADVPQAILRHGEDEAEKVFKWWLDTFGEDYFVELQRHGLKEQNIVNEVLVKFARKYNVPIIASNDSHYVDQEDSNAHDILLCVNTGEKQATPKQSDFTDDDVDVKTTRFAFPNEEFFFKSTAQMTKLFADLPDAIDNTNLIIDKVEPLKIARDVLLPHFPIPKEFKSQDDFLEFLTWEGAKQKYQIISPEADERIRFELKVIRDMGFAGYFLIVSDFIRAGRNMGVFVGPGRGSAAGSVVAYLTGITNIDPIKYNLLFERFLNPDRKSMPDIDTDFDDTGRQKVIDYVVEKYGKNQVAHIITYGTMAAKSSIKDVARVMDLPLQESNFLAKLVPDKPGTSLKRVLHAPIRSSEDSLEKKDELQNEDLINIEQLRKIYIDDKDVRSTILKEAEKLEGTVRNTGIHAAGIIIAPTDLTDFLPVCKVKDTALYVTQFEGSIIENAGALKMDFLGLKNLTILKDAMELIENNHGIKIDLDTLPLDDILTYELYQRGDTNGTFQFESVGMQKYLRELKPDKLDDLIAMNALYRPGPLAYIPEFIERKHGRKAIVYDLPEMEEYLAETYGITVYQEQVMLLSQKLANFSKGDADVLRKAMGKKQKEVLDKMKSKFIEGCEKNGHDKTICEKVWKDWEAFAQYAFNKSHSTCYAIVAYQTAYLKAHYPAEYMAAVLNSQGNIDRISFYMEECRRMNIQVLGPDINESNKGFSVNDKSIVRFGLGAIKGVGEAAVEDVLKERESKGAFKDIFDFVGRVNSRTVNKKSIESLVQAGAFDGFTEMHRAQYFYLGAGEQINNLEKLIKYGQAFESDANNFTNSLFGDLGNIEISKPKLSTCEEWSLSEKLEREKEMVGIYITAHPLDSFKFEIEHYRILKIEDAKLEVNHGKQVRLAGFVSNAQHLISKSDTKYGRFTIIDYSGQLEIMLFKNDYINFSKFFDLGNKIMLEGVYQRNPFSKDERFEFKIGKIELLENVKTNYTKTIEVNVYEENINDELTSQLKTYLTKNNGKTEIVFNIYNNKNEKLISLNTIKGVSIDDLILNELIHLSKNNLHVLTN